MDMQNRIQFMTMSDFGFGDIVLIKFPFTDISGAKKRPALVLHNTDDNDGIVCRITSQSKESEFDIEIKDWQASGLKLSSTIRLHKIVTLEVSLIDKKMGILSTIDMSMLKNRIKEILVKHL